MDKHTFILLCKSMLRPHVELELANSVWCPFKLGDIREIEKIQKRATKLVIKLKNKLYTDRLIYLNLPTLKYRRLRGDMIEVFLKSPIIYTIQQYHLIFRTMKELTPEEITINCIIIHSIMILY